MNANGDDELWINMVWNPATLVGKKRGSWEKADCYNQKFVKVMTLATADIFKRNYSPEAMASQKSRENNYSSKQNLKDSPYKEISPDSKEKSMT